MRKRIRIVGMNPSSRLRVIKICLYNLCWDFCLGSGLSLSWIWIVTLINDSYRESAREFLYRKVVNIMNSLSHWIEQNILKATQFTILAIGNTEWSLWWLEFQIFSLRFPPLDAQTSLPSYSIKQIVICAMLWSDFEH